MEWSEGADDDQYPVAPLPAHERAWRHPSEIGQAQWTYAEPPLTIGRGLVATTTSLGCLLAVAVLWAMWPSAGAGVSAVSTVATAILDTGSAESTRTSSSLALVNEPPITVTDVDTVTLPTVAPDNTEVAPTTSADVVTQQPTSSPPPIENAPAAALPVVTAVRIGDDLMLVTTAHAVGDRTELAVSIGADEGLVAQVLLVDIGSGLALLAADPAAVATITPYTMATALTDDMVIAEAADDQPLVMVRDANGIRWISGGRSDQAREGAPLVDDTGALVGLCSRTDQGTKVVEVSTLADLRLVVTRAQPGWMGLALDASADVELTIGLVDPSGPAAAAGLTAGDVIAAIDAMPILTARDLDAALAGRAPGDSIAVTVMRTGASQTVTLVLSSSTAMH